jgi:hypothetical protein
MIADLRSERDSITQAVLVLERLASSHGRRRGRPPSWMTAQIAAANEIGEAPPRAKRTRTMSAEVRRKMAEAQKKRWEAYRKAKGAN